MKHSKKDHTIEDDTCEEENQFKAPDGGWGWFVVLGVFLSYIITDGWCYSFGIFYKEFSDYFGTDKARTALIGALLYGIPMIISPVVCALVQVYDSRRVAVAGTVLTLLSFIISMFAVNIDTLVVSIGLICSVGLAMIYIPSIVIVTMYFEKHRGLATGLAVTGSGLGAFAFPPLISHLIEAYTWRGTSLVLGGIFLNILVSASLYKPLPPIKKIEIEREGTHLRSVEENGEHSLQEIELTHQGSSLTNDQHHDDVIITPTPYHKQNRCCAENLLVQEIKTICKNTLDKTLFKEKRYMLFCAATFIHYMWIGSPYVYIVDIASLKGIDAERGAFLLSVIGIARMFGQVSFGFLGDLPKLNPIALYGTSVVVSGLATLLMPVCYSYASFCVCCAVFGFAVSATYAIGMLCIVKLVGLDRATNGFGLLQLAQGVATVIGTPVAGALYDSTGVYAAAFYAAGGFIIAAGVITGAASLRWTS